MAADVGRITEQQRSRIIAEELDGLVRAVLSDEVGDTIGDAVGWLYRRTEALEAGLPVAEPGPNDIVLEHVDGVPWWEAPIPHRWHRCRRQTFGSKGLPELVERCACGAVRLDGVGSWMERNSRSRKP